TGPPLQTGNLWTRHALQGRVASTSRLDPRGPGRHYAESEDADWMTPRPAAQPPLPAGSASSYWESARRHPTPAYTHPPDLSRPGRAVHVAARPRLAADASHGVGAVDVAEAGSVGGDLAGQLQRDGAGAGVAQAVLGELAA